MASPGKLIEKRDVEPWEIERINQGESDINPYALTGDAEFFAVVSASNHSEIYRMLCQFFKQNWVERGVAS